MGTDDKPIYPFCREYSERCNRGAKSGRPNRPRMENPANPYSRALSPGLPLDTETQGKHKPRLKVMQRRRTGPEIGDRLIGPQSR